MAATASLSVLLQAVTGDFDKKMKRSSKNINTITARTQAASKAFKKMALSVAATAAAAFAVNRLARGFISMVKNGLESIDVLGKFAARLGIATEELQKLQFAAKVTGGVTDTTLNMALQRMTRRLAEAAQGTGEAVKAIKELGLSAVELGRLSPDQQFRAIADAMANVTSQADKVRLAFKFFDSEGVSLVTTLSLGSKGLDELNAKLKTTGGLITGLAAFQVAKANDELSLMGEIMKAISTTVVVDLAPGIAFLTKEFNEFLLSLQGLQKASAGMSFLTTIALGLVDVFTFFRIEWNAFLGLLQVGAGIVVTILEGIVLVARGVAILFEGTGNLLKPLSEGLADLRIAFGQLAGEDFEEAFGLATGGSAFTRFAENQELIREEFRKTQAAAEDASKGIGDAVKSAFSPFPKSEFSVFPRIIEDAAKKPIEAIKEELKELSGISGGGGRSFRFAESINNKQLGVLEEILTVLKSPQPTLILNEVGV